MFLFYLCRPQFALSLPHARGGVSKGKISDRRVNWSSPRPWGCFQLLSLPAQAAGVFPTPVGVFLQPSFLARRCIGLPHARGGVSQGSAVQPGCDWSSPRPWGCFLYIIGCKKQTHVFPTPVGVFLKGSRTLVTPDSLPHARGGVSFCFFFTFPPCASSPRPWGCFRTRFILDIIIAVFPTPVGVFPCAKRTFPFARSLPHTRGGVSIPVGISF